MYGAAVVMMGFLTASSVHTSPYWLCADAAGHQMQRNSPCPAGLQTLSDPWLSMQAIRELPDAAAARPPAAAQQNPATRRQLAAADTAASDAMPASKEPPPPSIRRRVPPWLFLLAVIAGAAGIAWWMRRSAAKEPSVRATNANRSAKRDDPRRHASVSIHEVLKKTANDTAQSIEWTPDLLGRLDWKRFEQLCCDYWGLKGYRAERMHKSGGDGGINLKIYSPADKQKLFAVAQCKSAAEGPVDAPALQALWAAVHHVEAKLALVYAVAGFTPAATAFAGGKHLKLISGDNLLQQISGLPAEQQLRLLADATVGDYTTPTCPHCDIKMVPRQLESDDQQDGWFWICPNHPDCQQRLPMAAQDPARRGAAVAAA